MSSVPHIAQVLALPDIHTDGDLVEAIAEGLPSATVRRLEGYGFAAAEIYSVVGPERTLRRRIGEKSPLTSREADGLVRMARIAALADDVFGDREKALRWLRKPKQHLLPGHRDTRPIDLVATEHGARLVENRLRQIQYGIVA